MSFVQQHALQKHSCWQFLVKELITRGLLLLPVVNDIRLFLHFGMTFRLKFSALKELLFQHLLADATTGKHPFLFISDGHVFYSHHHLPGAPFRVDRW